MMGEDLANNGMVEPEIDERWWNEWVEWGISSFETSLRNHAKFDEFLQAREVPNEP